MDNNLPNESKIIELHKKYAPSEEIFNHVYTHCLAVWKIAKQLITSSELKLDQQLVKSGCLLHDVGTYTLIQTSDPVNVGYIERGVIGEEILTSEGLPKALSAIVAHHVGHGLTKEHLTEVLSFLPHRDLTPKTPEERLVNYVSKLHGRSDKPHFISVNSYRSFLKNLDNSYYIEDFESLVQEFGEPNLESLAKEFSQPLL